MSVTLKIDIDSDALMPLDSCDFQGSIIFEGRRPKNGCFHRYEHYYDPLMHLLWMYTEDGERVKDTIHWRTRKDGTDDCAETRYDTWIHNLICRRLDKAGIVFREFEFSEWKGVMFATKEQLPNFTDKEQALTYFKRTERDLKAWADGEAYGYVIEDGDGEQISSCWGYYNREICESDGLAALRDAEATEYYENMESLLV